MKRDLLNRASSDLRMAEYAIQTGDDYDLCLGAYHVQQAAEKILKQLYLEQGVEFARTHDLAVLLSRLPNYDEYMSDDVYERFAEKAALLTEWETKTRYQEGYLVARIFVERNFKFIQSIYDTVLQTLQHADSLNSESGKSLVEALHLVQKTVKQLTLEDS